MINWRVEGIVIFVYYYHDYWVIYLHRSGWSCCYKSLRSSGEYLSDTNSTIYEINSNTSSQVRARTSRMSILLINFLKTFPLKVSVKKLASWNLVGTNLITVSTAWIFFPHYMTIEIDVVLTFWYIWCTTIWSATSLSQNNVTGFKYTCKILKKVFKPSEVKCCSTIGLVLSFSRWPEDCFLFFYTEILESPWYTWHKYFYYRTFCPICITISHNCRRLLIKDKSSLGLFFR